MSLCLEASWAHSSMFATGQDAAGGRPSTRSSGTHVEGSKASSVAAAAGFELPDSSSSQHTHWNASLQPMGLVLRVL